MKRQPQQTRDQLETFKETARALGCEESEERFDEQLRGIAKAKHKPKTKEPGAKPGSK